MTEIVGIMLVDDHAIVRQGLRSILEREQDLRVVAEASSAAEALSLFMERVLTQHPGDWHFWDEFEPGRFLEDA